MQNTLSYKKTVGPVWQSMDELTFYTSILEKETEVVEPEEEAMTMHCCEDEDDAEPNYILCVKSSVCLHVRQHLFHQPGR